mmetsp:Transcript_62030/g.145522  ORF Transcript_62030/g.145522 Transcript_62030/m.145522 type:complete len:240 (-) Transcript_62030:802-1521(-)
MVVCGSKTCGPSMGQTSVAWASRMYTHRKRMLFRPHRLASKSFSTWMAPRNGGQVQEPAHTTVRSPHQSFSLLLWPSRPTKATSGSGIPGFRKPSSARFARAYTDSLASFGATVWAVCMCLTAAAIPTADLNPLSIATSRCKSRTTSSHSPPEAVQARMRSSVSGAKRSSSWRLSILSSSASSRCGSSGSVAGGSSSAVAVFWAAFLDIQKAASFAISWPLDWTSSKRRSSSSMRQDCK